MSAVDGAQVRETHSGVVVLVGDRAYKMKKAVDLGFLDFRTEQARHDACRRELELNRRLAPDVYLDVAAVTGSDDRVCEHLLVMRRMPEQLRLSTLVLAGGPVDAQLLALARLIAEFHATARRDDEVARAGRAEALRRRWSNNLDETERYRGQVLDAELHAEIRRMALAYVDGRGQLLDERADAGFVVDGHGDLIAEDVFCLPDYPRVLDCLEFDDQLRWVDVLDDVAFLAMDLERLGRPELAERFLRWYGGFSRVPVVPSLREHYLAYRAFVRSKVECIRAAQGSPDAAAQAAALASLSLRHLQAGEVKLVLVGGAPGTGKTTLACQLAARLDATLLRTDELRREHPAPDVYSPQAKAATYRMLLQRARNAMRHGRSVVADATWPTAELRDAARAAAEATDSRLVSLECRLPVNLAAARAQHRRDHELDASDADAWVARRLASGRDPWPDAVAIDTAASPHQVLERALAATGGPSPVLIGTKAPALAGR